MTQYTFTQENDYSLLKDGEYEVRIERIEERTTPNGKQNLSIMFRVRDDVEQAGKNRVLFDTIWKEKDTDFYNRKRLNQLLGTQHFEDGKVFNGIKDIIEELKNAPLITVITTSFNDYKSEDENKVSYYKSSNNLPKALDAKKETKKETVIATEDDLPF
jgi:hypothetical protein